ncbi:MAG: TonB-dependent receptor domain-containing protein, partial [Gemmatimonadota bacterium]
MTVTAPQEERSGWTIQQAEELLLSLKGVVSARLVTRPGGEVEEVHLLTTHEVAPKQTVRNVESALLAHLGISLDHRKISVAQTKEAPAPQVADIPPVALVEDLFAGEHRLLFQSHGVETERSRKVRHRVEIEWKGTSYSGQATSADLPRARLEAVAEATLQAVELAVAGVTWVPTDGDPEVVAYFSYSEGFRTPTVNELFAFFPFSSNPDLEAPTSRTFELGSRVRVGEYFQGTLALFHTDVNDEIFFVVTDPTTGGGINQNVPQTRRRGLELTL